MQIINFQTKHKSYVYEVKKKERKKEIDLNYLSLMCEVYMIIKV